MRLLEALLVTGAFAVAAYLLAMISLGGAFGGLVVGTLVYLSLGWPGFGVLALFVVGASVLTRLGYSIKSGRGAAEAGRGRRGWRNALANCGVAVVLAALAALTGRPEVLTAAFVAALAAAFADTAESEVGTLSGRRPVLLSSLRPVAPGTDGAVSLTGTLAGLAAAALAAGFGYAVGLVGGGVGVLIVALAGFGGTLVDSYIGAVAPKVGNELTNVICTLSAAIFCGLALLLEALLGG